MSTVVDTVRAAFDRVANFRYLEPRDNVVIDAALHSMRSHYETHLRTVAPFARGELPEPRVERHDSVASVWSRIGLGVPANAVPPKKLAPGEPVAPLHPSGFGSPPPPIVTSEPFRTWSRSYGAILTDSATRLRTSVDVPRRIAELGAAFGVEPTYGDPYHALGQVLAEAHRRVYWEHPARAPSERVEAIVQQPHQVAARALEEHVRWVVAHDDASGSPFEAILEIWSLALWPVMAPDGVLLVLCPSQSAGRVVFRANEPDAPWPKLGSRVSGGNVDEGWREFDEYVGAICAMGLGPLPGSLSVMHAWGPPGGPR